MWLKTRLKGQQLRKRAIEMIKISQRAEALEFSPIRKLMPMAVQAKAKGIKVYHLNIGQPDIESPKVFLKKVREFNQKVIAYEKSDGTEALKNSLVRYYQRLNLNINQEDMVVTTGGSEALWMAFFILFSKGDECLTLDPTYTSYLTFSALGGVKLKAVPTYLEEDFQLPTIDKIKKSVTKKTKAIIITNPSNPTGSVYPKEMLKDLVDFCVKRGIFIIADETYREFVYEGKAVSLLSFKKASQVVLLADSLSKRYSLCGARIGVLVSKNKSIIKAALKMAQARLATASIEQYAASFLHQVPKEYFENVRREYKKRRDTLMKGLGQINGVKFNSPDGAFYLIAELPVKNAEKFCQFLLEKFEDRRETIMLAPAEGFYVTPETGKNQVRIAYVLNQKDLQRACWLLKKGLEAYQRAE